MSKIDIADTVSLLRQVNLNHMVYFWTVARTGSFTQAARELGISQPSISEQVASLERRLGRELFRRTGRGVELTLDGQRAFRYAEEVVGMCAELVRMQPLNGTVEPVVLEVGCADAMPKVVVRSILKPLLDHPSKPRLILREWRVDALLAELGVRRMDFVICDSPYSSVGDSPVISFEAANSGVTLCASPSLAAAAVKNFPQSMESIPLLLPPVGAALRAELDRYFAANAIRPSITMEAEDRSQLHHFAEQGVGAVPVATCTVDEVERQFSLKRIGTLEGVSEGYYVVMSDRPARVPVLDELRAMLSQKFRSVTPTNAAPKPVRA
jgi:LysR family transcriptional regulator, transcriptional activator of nhaA